MTGNDLMNGSMVGAIVWQKLQPVAGPGGGEVEVALFNGSVEFANGKTGTYAGVETVDLGDARAPFSGHRIVMLADGSKSNQSFDGWTTSAPGPKQFRGEGTWRLIDGTGRFAGLRGGGTFRWELDGADYRETFSG